jgi:hypothetical protein
VIPEQAEVKYPAAPIAAAFPERLAVAARLRGLEPCLPERARVLELGCAGGGNLLPLAASWPGCTCVGLDIDRTAIDGAAELARDLGLGNARFHAVDLREARSLLGDQRFDYVVAHGVYSWVSEAARSALLELCGAVLAEQGVVYLSYGSYPGFHVQQVLRDMLRFHVSAPAGSLLAVQQARELIAALLAQPLPGLATPELLRRELVALADAGDVRLTYDDLAETQGFWLEDVVERAARHGLAFLGDASAAAYADLLGVRRFNRTLLCRSERRPAGQDPARLLGLRVACPPFAPLPPVTAAAWQLPGDGGVVVSVRDARLRAALDRIRRAWPETLAVDELGSDPGLLGALLELSEAGVVRLALGEPACVSGVSERPAASPYARACARLGRPIASQYHEQVPLPPRHRELLQLLDGQRDQAALAALFGEPLPQMLQDLVSNALLIA